MRRAAAVLSILGLGAAAATVFVLGPQNAPAPPPTPDPIVVAAPAVRLEKPTARPIAPEIVPPPAIEPMGLVRVEPRSPLSTQAAPEKRRKDHGRIFTPLIESAGRISGGGLAIDIAGIEPMAADATCTDSSGKEWQCGLRARAALRAFVRGRALQCDLPDEITEKRYVVACAVGPDDIGKWLVAQGWARGVADGPYAEQLAAAKAARKGIFGDAPTLEPLPLSLSGLEPAKPPVLP